MPVSIDDGRGAAVEVRGRGVSLAVAGGGAVSITPIMPFPVDPIYRIAFTPSAALTAIGAVTQTRAFAIGAAAATQFLAAVVQARSSQMQAAAALQPVGGKTDSRSIQFSPSARMDPFVEGAQIEARDIRLTPSAALSPVGAQAEVRSVQTSSTAELQPVGGRVVSRSAAIAASVTTGFVGEAVSVAFDPASVFALDDNGAIYDPSDLTTLFKDSDAEFPVTSDSDPVGCILDLSGNGHHAKQATAADRPVYRTDGTLHWIKFDGTSQHLRTEAFSLSSNGAISTVATAVNAGTGTGQILSMDDNDSVRIGQLLRLGGTNGNVGQASGFTSTDDTIFVGTGEELAGPQVLFSKLNASGSAISTDGGVESTKTTGAQKTTAALEPLFIGRRGPSKFSRELLNGDFYGGLTIDRNVTSSEESSLIQYFAEKGGVTL